MAVVRQTLVYDGPGGPFEGVAAWDDAVSGPRPAVLVLPNILGQKEEDNVKADALAALGTVALVADVYGQGKRTTLRDPEMGRYMAELNADRALLRARMEASLAALAGLEQADAARMAAIGFCFGGKCVLDMARAGLPILGGSPSTASMTGPITPMSRRSPPSCWSAMAGKTRSRRPRRRSRSPGS